MVRLAREIAFDPQHADEILAALPASRAVFLLLPEEASPALAGASGAEPYLSRTVDLRRRLSRLLRPPAKPTKAVNLHAFTRYIAYQETGSEFETTFLLYRLARELFPHAYRERLRLKPPALLKINLRHPWPRCYVTRRLADDSARSAALYFGPFPQVLTAQRFADEFLNFFKIRRCSFRINPDPNFPGCIYSEMKMCLGPCFAGCTRADYTRELDRVLSFLSTGGKSLHDELASARDAASGTLEFERAARLHARLEKLESTLRVKGELARPLDALNAVILQPGAEPRSLGVELYRVSAGAIAHAGTVRFAALARQPVSLEIILRDLLEATPAATLDPAQRGEHLWLLTRWFCSRPRTGEILFLEAGQLPYRKLIRLCGKILQGTQKPLPFIPPESR